MVGSENTNPIVLDIGNVSGLKKKKIVSTQIHSVIELVHTSSGAGNEASCSALPKLESISRRHEIDNPKKQNVLTWRQIAWRLSTEKCKPSTLHEGKCDSTWVKFENESHNRARLFPPSQVEMHMLSTIYTQMFVSSSLLVDSLPHHHYHQHYPGLWKCCNAEVVHVPFGVVVVIIVSTLSSRIRLVTRTVLIFGPCPSTLRNGSNLVI